MSTTSQPDPVRLEIFKNLYQFIAEQMGIVLQNTAASVNIKERLDFSCAIFDASGLLVANAPHIPVHLGSMSESVRSLINDQGDTIKPGNVYLSNNPYNGGTHLPDVTVITPVFLETNDNTASPTPLFFVASRGHQGDIGGITPGSMPPHSTTVEEEGILFDNFLLVEQGNFHEIQVRNFLRNHKYPTRNSDQNIADFKAQIAANERGVQELHKMVAQSGLKTVQAYMQFVQNNAEESVRRAIDVLQDGSFIYHMDNGAEIHVQVLIDRENRHATIDFTGTSEQLNSNFNAPKAVTQAAVLYVFRTLVDDSIPLNAGCLKPLKIIIPEGCMLNPAYPAAVVAGNVETSQTIVDALYGALGVMAASQGTMNNFTFGNERYQYYETICGGSGAGANFDGTDAVQTHMTNSRLTDPEILETRYPVQVESFCLRPDSGGKGKYSGGNGVIRRIKFLEPMTANILSGHRRVPPFGLNCGEAGQVGRNWIERQDGTQENLDSTATVEMLSGDVFVIETPGGGGFGSTARMKRVLPRLEAITADAGASLILTSASLLANSDGNHLMFKAKSSVSRLNGRASLLLNYYLAGGEIAQKTPQLATIPWIATEKIPSQLAAQWQQPEINGDTLAYLQYTSGSTSTPKGVMLDHKNLMGHLAELQQACGYDSHSVTVTWMPYFHDYGLVEGILAPLYNGTPSYLMSPMTFIKQPLQWLKAISHYRVTHSQAPNFAYAYCLKRITPSERATLDLSCWQAAGNAAEPINPEVIEQFCQTFESCGFRRQTFAPAYGLAEATLLVTTSRKTDEPVFCTVSAEELAQNRLVPSVSGQRLAGSGRLLENTLVAIKRGSVGLPIPGCGGLDSSQPVKQQVSFVNLRCSRYIACN